LTNDPDFTKGNEKNVIDLDEIQSQVEVVGEAKANGPRDSMVAEDDHIMDMSEYEENPNQVKINRHSINIVAIN
jgi:hypothetical protein